MKEELKKELEGIKKQIDFLNDPKSCDLTDYTNLTKITLEVEKIKVLDRIAVALEILTEQQKGK
jgi:hypothetical protein